MEENASTEGDGGVFHGLRIRLEGFDTEREDEYHKRIRRQSGKIEKNYDWMGLYFITSSEKVQNLDPIAVLARSKGAIVVNELWLDDSLKNGALADTGNILYRPPVELGGVKGSQCLKIAHTGFHCKDSEYIKRLVEMLGAETVEITDCSYLLCNTLEDYNASKEMRDLFRVNLKWLEDCVSDWTILSVDDDRYISWPRKVRNYRTPIKEKDHVTSQREDPSTGNKSKSQLGKGSRGSPDEETLVKRKAESSGNKNLHPPPERDQATSSKRFLSFNCQRLSDLSGRDLVVTVQIPCSRKQRDVGTELIKGVLLGCYTEIVDIHNRGECIRNAITASGFIVSVQSYKVTLEHAQLVPYDEKLAKENKDHFVKMVNKLFNEKHWPVPADICVWISCIMDGVPDNVLKKHINMQHPLDIFGSFTAMYYVLLNLKEPPEDLLTYLLVVDSNMMERYKTWKEKGFDWDLLNHSLTYIHPNQIELTRLRNKHKGMDTEETIL